MNERSNASHDNLIPALEAIGKLLEQDLSLLIFSGNQSALSAHSEIGVVSIHSKSAAFYRHLVPWRENLVSILAGGYRRFFKVALAHPHDAGRGPHQWALLQLQPTLEEMMGRIGDWYVLACDGENQA
jgi:hypothetical protein